MSPRIDFHAGTIRLFDVPLDSAEGLGVAFDARENVLRAPALAYRQVILAARERGLELVDDARRYEALPLVLRTERSPYPHQRDALHAWKRAGGIGVVVLPTGAGKTFMAALAIADKKRSTLIIVPTLDLMMQWQSGLSAMFGCTIGLVGGGTYDLQEITVTTYDSAHLYMERFGNRFGLVVFDECHHLPSDAYSLAAKMCLAPFRLGLSATPERTDGRETLLDELVGPVCYRRDITDLSGHYLAPYETVRIEVPLTPTEREAYEEARATYVQFVRQEGIDFGSPGGFGEFLLKSSYSDGGRRAFVAYRKQRQLALAAPGKMAVLDDILRSHARGRVLIFTEDNRTVYELSRRLLLPAITHQTKARERANTLRAFADGELFAIVTSKVLNEGVDVPSADVAIVLSGNGSVREHVQRLGRILRKVGDKRATLYELVSKGTSETSTSERRRQHRAYQ